MATDSTPPVSPEVQRLAAPHQFALANPAVPKIYGNGFGVNVGTSDIGLLIALNDFPTGLISMSYPAAKRLGSLLLEAVAKFEEISGTRVSDLVELEAAVRKATQESGQ